MKFYLKLIALVLVYFALTACNKSIEEKALAEASKSDDGGGQIGPKCGWRDKNHNMIVPGGCTKQQMEDWHKAQ